MLAKGSFRWLALGAAVVVAAVLMISIDWSPSGEGATALTREESLPEAPPPPRLEGSGPRPAEATDPAGDLHEPSPPDSGRTVRYAVEGIVRDATTGDGVPYVGVLGWRRTFDFETRKVGRETFRAEADRDGRFRLEVEATWDVPITEFEVEGREWQVFDWHRATEEKGRDILVAKGAVTPVVLHVRRTFWLQGIVEDERGSPLSGVSIRYSHVALPRIRSAGGRTGPDGTFDIGPFAEDPRVGFTESQWKDVERWTLVTFLHEGYASMRLDPREVPALDRDRWTVTMTRGYVLAGVLVDEDGRPLPGVAVAAEYGKNWELRRGARTDQDGRWRLENLSPEPMVLSARAFAHGAKAKREMTLEADDLDVRLVAERIHLTELPRTTRVLGLELADVTDELREAYDVPAYVHVLIVDPGEDSDALGIGRLEHGYGLYYVGEKNVASVEEAVRELIEPSTTSDVARPAARRRIVYTFWNERMAGTNTQHTTLTEAQLADLRVLRERLER